MPAFSAGDLLEGVAQHIAMVESDRGDDGHLRLHDVGRVEAAAKPDLDHAHVRRAPRELQERHRRHEFEETRMVVRSAREPRGAPPPAATRPRRR